MCLLLGTPLYVRLFCPIYYFILLLLSLRNCFLVRVIKAVDADGQGEQEEVGGAE